MYKYIKGETVLSEEKMPSSFDIAQKYGLWRRDIEDEELIPNGILIDAIIDTYIKRNNLTVSEYYYIDSMTNISFPVYQNKLVEPCMSEFMKYIKENNVVSDKSKTYSFVDSDLNDIEFVYFKKKSKKATIIDFKDLKNRKE